MTAHLHQEIEELKKCRKEMEQICHQMRQQLGSTVNKNAFKCFQCSQTYASNENGFIFPSICQHKICQACLKDQLASTDGNQTKCKICKKQFIIEDLIEAFPERIADELKRLLEKSQQRRSSSAPSSLSMACPKCALAVKKSYQQCNRIVCKSCETKFCLECGKKIDRLFDSHKQCAIFNFN